MGSARHVWGLVTGRDWAVSRSAGVAGDAHRRRPFECSVSWPAARTPSGRDVPHVQVVCPPRKKSYCWRRTAGRRPSWM